MGTGPSEDMLKKTMWLMQHRLDPIRARDAALFQFIREELSGVGTLIDQMSERFRLVAEFNEIWPHYVPSVEELADADRAGCLEEKIKEINEAFARGE